MGKEQLDVWYLKRKFYSLRKIGIRKKYHFDSIQIQCKSKSIRFFQKDGLKLDYSMCFRELGKNQLFLLLDKLTYILRIEKK